MHQYKTVAQILFILSILDLVFATPVVRETYDANDDVVPIVVRNVAAMSNGRRQPASLDESTSNSSPPPPLDGPTPLHGLSPSDGPASLPSPPSGPAALAVSSPPDRTASLPIVPASGRPAVFATSQHLGVTHEMLEPGPKKFGTLGKVIAVGSLIVAVTGGLLWHHRHSLRHLTIGPDRYVSDPSHRSCRRLNVPNYK